MKNFKYIILGILISLVIFFLIGVISSHINRNQVIHIKSYDGFNDDINALALKIDKVKNDDCRTSLNYMLDRIKENNITGDVKIKDYYESFYKDDLTFVDLYNYISSTCSIKNNSIYVKAMSTLVYPNYIKNKYNRSYEFYLKDYSFNDDSLDEMGSYSTIVNEITVLSDLLKEIE